MKKLFTIILCALLLCTLALPAVAITLGPIEDTIITDNFAVDTAVSVFLDDYLNEIYMYTDENFAAHTIAAIPMEKTGKTLTIYEKM